MSAGGSVAVAPPGIGVERTARHARRHLLPLILLAPAMLWMAVFYLLPLGLMIVAAFRENGAAGLIPFLTSSTYRSVFLTTFEIGLVTTLGCLALGYPVAYALTVSRGSVRAVLLAIVSLPYWLDYVVRSFSWMVLLGRKGLVNDTLIATGLIHEPLKLLYSFFSVCIGMIQVLLPLMILTLFGAMLRIDRRLIAAAVIHGAGPWRAFRTVFFPLSLPGVYAAALLVFISSLGFYIIPALIGGPHETMISQSILMLAGTLLRWGDASILGLILLVLTMTITLAYDSVFSIDRLWGGGDDERG